MKEVVYHGDSPSCPECNSTRVRYEGFEDTEIFECRDCGVTFGATNPAHT